MFGINLKREDGKRKRIILCFSGGFDSTLLLCSMISEIAEMTEDEIPDVVLSHTNSKNIIRNELEMNSFLRIYGVFKTACPSLMEHVKLSVSTVNVDDNMKLKIPDTEEVIRRPSLSWEPQGISASITHAIAGIAGTSVSYDENIILFGLNKDDHFLAYGEDFKKVIYAYKPMLDANNSSIWDVQFPLNNLSKVEIIDLLVTLLYDPEYEYGLMFASSTLQRNMMVSRMILRNITSCDRMLCVGTNGEVRPRDKSCLEHVYEEWID